MRRPGAIVANPSALAATVAGLVALAVYLATLAPGLPAGDSGELITVAAIGGVAHPPGYPLYTLIGRAWIALLPLGDVAWRMNLLSAVCAALAVAVLARAVSRASGSVGAGLIAAAALAFSPPFWKMAVVAEVFALNALLAAGLLDALVRLLAAARGEGGGGARAALAIAFVSGLLVAHHHTLVLLALPVAATGLVVAWRNPRAAPGVRPWQVAGMLLLGASPLLYLPLAAAHSPALSWGDVHSLRELLRLLLRVDYGTFRLDPLAAGHEVDLWRHAGLYARSLPSSLGLPALALALAGLSALARRPALAAALGGFALLQLAFFSRIGFPTEPAVLLGVVERFHVLPNVVVAFVAGLGAAWALRSLARLAPRATPALVAALAALTAAVPLVAHHSRVDQRGNRFVEHLAADVLASVPANAVLFVQGDLFHNGLSYLLHVRKLRPDVTLVDQELLTFDWYVRALRRRAPDVLPPLGGGERLTLGDGRTLEGVPIGGDAASLELLTVEGALRVPRAAIATRDTAPDPGTLYAAARARFRRHPLAPVVEDRYSGLPGTMNLRWLDHLRGRRPAAFIGLKDDSWALRYEMIPIGHVLIAHPRGAAPTVAERVRLALDQLAAFHLDDALATYEPWSFERAETARVREFVARAAILLCQPEAAAPDLARHPGLDRLAAFLARFEPLEPTPDPTLLRAAGLLRVHHARFRDPAAAVRLLERYLAAAPGGPESDEAREAMAVARAMAR